MGEDYQKDVSERPCKAPVSLSLWRQNQNSTVSLRSRYNQLKHQKQNIKRCVKTSSNGVII